MKWRLGQARAISAATAIIGTPPQFTATGAVYACPGLTGAYAHAASDWALNLPVANDQALYLAVLVDEGLASVQDAAIAISWPDLYTLLADPDQANSMPLLLLPLLSQAARPILNEQGTVSDKAFTILVTGWIDDGGRELPAQRYANGILNGPAGPCLVPAESWALISKLDRFARRPPAAHTQSAHELAWADIRAAALRAAARLSPYLQGTIVLTPDTLDLRYDHAEVNGTRVTRIRPDFEDAPARWLELFDRQEAVPPHLDVPAAAGKTRIIFTPPVQRVLQALKAEFPERYAGGRRAEAFIRNPYALLGEEAATVLDERQIDAAKQDAGLYPTRLALHPVMQHGTVVAVETLVTIIQGAQGKTVRARLDEPAALDGVLQSLRHALGDQRQVFSYASHAVDIDGDSPVLLENGLRILAAWQAQQRKRIAFGDIYELSHYGDRIEGIGVTKPIYSAYINLPKAEQSSWNPEITPVIGIPLADGTEALVPLDRAWLQDFARQVKDAEFRQLDAVKSTDLPIPMPLAEAKRLVDSLETLLGDDPAGLSDPHSRKPLDGIPGPAGQTTDALPPRQREKLQLKANIKTLDYSETALAAARETRLLPPAGLVPALPRSLRPAIALKPHQRQGVAWLQHLLARGTNECRGALLADDMGLGKTVQLLTVLARYYEDQPDALPSLIVAPVALLENWRQETEKFFTRFPPVLVLHGKTLQQRRVGKDDIAAALLERKITNLLQPDWLQDYKIIITTYETVRDYEFSFAMQKFTFVICDEAQKIKSPAAMVTGAVKKQQALFRIACTGTPVENNLVDLWCLFDFIQPGLLGALDEFGATYRRPIEVQSASQQQKLDELRALIKPQIIRRMKEDLRAGELPAKERVTNDSYLLGDRSQLRLALPLSPYQRAKYVQGKAALAHDTAEAGTDNRKKATVSFESLHLFKAICAEPYCLPKTRFQEDPRGLAAHLQNAPKTAWLLQQLQAIEAKNEKVIVFTEGREIQRALQFFIFKQFSFRAQVINGDTDARQGVIDAFQEKPGFGVIILSPYAAGFGLNIVAANHVIHFTRTWNPAKEGQATDRAYRIGQTKTVHVYCPTIVAPDFVTFEDKLDRLMGSKQALAGDMLNGVGTEFSVAELLDDHVAAGSRTQAVPLANQIDALDGQQFEAACQQLWGRLSGSAYVTPKAGGDGGIDVVAIDLQRRQGFLIQCKHCARADGAVGWDAVKEVVAGAARYMAKHPDILFTKLAVTNARFNANAALQAQLQNVKLLQRDELLALLESTEKPT